MEVRKGSHILINDPSNPAQDSILLSRLLSFCLVATALLVCQRSYAGVEPTAGTFIYDGTPIDEFHCVPADSGQHPAVIMIHSCGKIGFGHEEYRQMCRSLAEHSYYAEFVEYYSKTGAPNCAQFSIDPENNLSAQLPLPSEVYIRTIHAAIDSLQDNPHVDATRIGLLAFGDGVVEALTIGPDRPANVRAIVGYYANVTPRLKAGVIKAKLFPPTLMLRGDGDSRVSGSYSAELEDDIAEHGGEHEVHVYPGAEHGFNFHEARGFDAYASKDAWTRTLAFLDAHLL
ncbi:MAG TPA: dienelactone hydrolase family protein [Candidatus Binataceae bacterium]|nr:dienelactone hydrolase family protein [Candidatus Binataceae bacterium]